MMGHAAGKSPGSPQVGQRAAVRAAAHHMYNLAHNPRPSLFSGGLGCSPWIEVLSDADQLPGNRSRNSQPTPPGEHCFVLGRSGEVS